MRRFPPPWTVEAIEAGFKVLDANGQTLAYVYGHADARTLLNHLAKMKREAARSPDAIRSIRDTVARRIKIVAVRAHSRRYYHMRRNVRRYYHRRHIVRRHYHVRHDYHRRHIRGAIADAVAIFTVKAPPATAPHQGDIVRQGFDCHGQG
jgi:hypothetical protein